MEPKGIIERLNINRDTFFVGVAKLKELRLYDYKEKLAQAKQDLQNRSHKDHRSDISD